MAWYNDAWDWTKDAASDVGDWAWKNRWIATPFAPAPIIASYAAEGVANDITDERKDVAKAKQDIDDLSGDLTEEEPLNVDWETGIVTDSNKVPVKDYSGYYDRIEEAANTDIPTLDEYMTEHGYAFNDPLAQDEDGNYTNPVMQDTESLISELREGPSEEELAAANEYAASMMGLSTEEYQEMLRGMSLALEGGVNGMEGMSEEEQALREKANRSELQYMETRAARQIENIQASTGSASRSYAAADEAMRSINDAQIQQQVALADEKFRRKMAQYESQQQMWGQMVQNGQMSQSQYLQLIQTGKAQAFQGYSLQMNSMFQQNQEYLQRYGQELASVQAVLDNTYKAVMTEMGVDQAIMDFTEQEYNMRIQPLLQQLQIATGQWERENAEAQQTEAFWMDLFGLGISLAGLFI